VHFYAENGEIYSEYLSTKWTNYGFMHEKWGQTTMLDPALNWPPWPRASAVYGSPSLWGTLAMVDPRYSGPSLWGTGTHNTGENGDLHAHRRVYL